MTEESSSPADDTLAPKVDKLRQRVKQGEVPQSDLDLALYMTDPNAPFPIRGMTELEFMKEWSRSSLAKLAK